MDGDKTRTPTGARPRGSGSVVVYETLKREILTLDLAPGSVLDEADIARRFGVSRSPVREALIRLTGDRLVLGLRNRSTVVAPIEFLALSSHLEAVRLMYRVTCRLAALRRNTGDIEVLESLQETHDQATRAGDFAAIVRANGAFHLQIARIAGNGHFEAWQAGLLEEGERYMHLCIRQLGAPAPPLLGGGHRAIIAAIAAGDADRADVAGAEDAGILKRSLASLLEEQPAADLRAPGADHPPAATSV
jgi:DNA-binding GntR family transcriptional regulator